MVFLGGKIKHASESCRPTVIWRTDKALDRTEAPAL